MPEQDLMPSDDQESDDQNWPQETSDDDNFLPDEPKGAERITPRSQFLYSQICLFEETREVLQFYNRNYKVSISVRLTANMIQTVKTVFEMNAEPKRIRKFFM